MCASSALVAAARGASVDSSVAATSNSRCQRPTSACLYLIGMLSPCSVRRSWPATVPGGCARIASKLDPPPRHTEPPRPWNRRSRTPRALNTSTSSRSAWYSVQFEVRKPPSLLLSEYPSMTSCVPPCASLTRWRDRKEHTSELQSRENLVCRL